MIEAKMAQLGTTNMGAYLRKMAIDGYVVKLDLPELRELVSLLRYSSNNLNQLTRRVHETGRGYAADMEDILQNQERIWQAARGILSRLAAIKYRGIYPMWGRRAARRPPLLFCSPSSLQSGAYSCILFSQYKTNGGKSDAHTFKAPVCAGHG